MTKKYSDPSSSSTPSHSRASSMTPTTSKQDIQTQTNSRFSLSKLKAFNPSSAVRNSFSQTPLISNHRSSHPLSTTSTTTIMTNDSSITQKTESHKLKTYDISSIPNSPRPSTSSIRPTIGSYAQDSNPFDPTEPAVPQPARIHNHNYNYNYNQNHNHDHDPYDNFLNYPQEEAAIGYTYVNPYTKEVTYRQPASGFSTWYSDSDNDEPSTPNRTTPVTENSKHKKAQSKTVSNTLELSTSLSTTTALPRRDHISKPLQPPHVRSKVGQWMHNFKDSFQIVKGEEPVDLIPTETSDHADDELTATYANPNVTYYKNRPNSTGGGDEYSKNPNDDDKKDLDLIRKAAIKTANAPLLRSLAPRHIKMIAFGGAVGTGLFIGTGSSLATSGPGSLLIGFAVIGLMLVLTISALAEMAVCFPVSGAFTAYSARFISMVAGSVVGWGYAMQWMVSVPLELVAAAMTVNYWTTTNLAIWVLVFWLFLCLINLFGVRIFGEIEFAFALIKVIAIIGFIILGIVTICGGVPSRGYIGGKYWTDPGAFNNGAKGLFTVFVNASFSYAGTELSGLTAAEAKNPRKAIPSAVKQVCWRIIIFYFTSLTIVGCLLPYNDPKLLPSANNTDSDVSPFVIALETTGLKGIPSVFNAAVLVAVLSVANSSVYATTRTLAALAAQGQAPKQLGYIDKQGRPIVSLVITLLFGLVAFVAPSPKAPEVFTWLLSISGLACVFTWASICLCHIRFRYALKAQNRSTSELLYKAPFGVYGSILGLALNIFVIVIVFWVALFPIDPTGKNSGKADVYKFFSIYLCVPLTLVFYFCCSFYQPAKIIKLKDIDLDTGRREVDIELIQLEMEEETRYIREKGPLHYMYRLLC